ncbi:DUF3986 family protein [Peribacillus frigoritolerans]|uniref:DUF3986 family protein n=1 Tax=Peribacillus frigoritolerans TaxID=450367 RepID=UPI003F7E106D
MTKSTISPNYYDDEHWHISYNKNNHDIEGIGFRRRDDNTWDIYFGDFINDLEYKILFGKVKILKDETFGVLIFNGRESEVIDKFQRWVEEFLIPLRVKMP